jgi:hypothetical protein
MHKLVDPTGIDLKSLCDPSIEKDYFSDLAQVTIRD